MIPPIGSLFCILKLILKVDATVHGELAKEFGVGGYPTLKWFKGSDRSAPTDYKGGRKADEIVSWCKKKSGPPTVAINGADAAKKFSEDNEVRFSTLFQT